MEELASSALAQKVRCAVVTGGNKGIGLEICRQLASSGILVVLTARDEKRGVEAVEKLKESGLSNIIFHQLDITDPISIDSLTKFINTQFGKLDILVNNAANLGAVLDSEPFRALNGFWFVLDENANELKKVIEQTYAKAEECLKTNYYGTKGVTEALIPLLRLSESARIVNLTSTYGLLSNIPNENIKAQFRDIDLTVAQLESLLQSFLKDFKEDKLESNGWPLTVSAYKISKVAVNAYTTILARRFPMFRINCVHPGYIQTDITCNTGPNTPEEGARGPVMLALLPDDGPSGSFFNELQISSFY